MKITKENHAFFRERAKLARQARLLVAEQLAAQVADFASSKPASWLLALDEQHGMLRRLLERELSGQGAPSGRGKRIQSLLNCQRALIEQRQKLTAEPSTFGVAAKAGTVLPIGATMPAKVGVRMSPTDACVSRPAQVDGDNGEQEPADL